MSKLSERWDSIKASGLNIRRAFGVVWETHTLSALGMAASTLIGAP